MTKRFDEPDDDQQRRLLAFAELLDEASELASRKMPKRMIEGQSGSDFVSSARRLFLGQHSGALIAFQGFGVELVAEVGGESVRKTLLDYCENWLTRKGRDKFIEASRRYYRQQKLRKENLEAQSSVPCSNDLIDELQWVQFYVSSAMEKLRSEAPDAAEIIELRHIHELTFAEIGESLGIAAATAFQTYKRAMNRLRELVASVANDDNYKEIDGLVRPGRDETEPSES